MAADIIILRQLLEWLKKLDRHDPVPPTADTEALYTRAERALGALRFKYTACLGATGCDAATCFGDGRSAACVPSIDASSPRADSS